MTSSTHALLVCFLAIPALAASYPPSTPHDPAFETIPFQEWISGPASPDRIHWSARVTPAQLSFHQRLVATVDVQVDGADLARRRGAGEFVVFTQFTDESGKTYQTHTSVNLTRAEEGLSASDVHYVTKSFVLPGDYQVAILLLNSASREHWSKTERVHFAPLHHDPFPDSWKNLPPVETVPHADPPESWLLPGVPEHLNLPAEINSPVRIDVLVNLSPSERQSGSTRIRNETLDALIPTLKVISEMRFTPASGNGRPGGEAAINIALLDLSLRRVVFHRNNVHDLDWETLQEAFAQNSTNTIDVHSLEDRGRNAAFFVKEVSRRISADPPSGAKHVIIVLSGATSFESGEDLRPIEASPDHCPVFYIRYQPSVIRQLPQREERGFGRRGGLRGMEDPQRPRQDFGRESDQLEKTLKPVTPHVYDVSDPEQMRKALASLRDNIEAL